MSTTDYKRLICLRLRNKATGQTSGIVIFTEYFKHLSVKTINRRLNSQWHVKKSFRGVTEVIQPQQSARELQLCPRWRGSSALQHLKRKAPLQLCMCSKQVAQSFGCLACKCTDGAPPGLKRLHLSWFFFMKHKMAKRFRKPKKQRADRNWKTRTKKTQMCTHTCRQGKEEVKHTGETQA